VTWDENDVDIVGTWIGPTLPDPTFYLYGTPPVEGDGADAAPVAHAEHA
jgi:hypothetical protein